MKVVRAVGTAAAWAPVAVGVIHVTFLQAQPDASRKPRFDVGSIKRSAKCSSRSSIYGALLSPSPGTLTLDFSTLAGLILGAYGRYANGRTRFSLPPPIRGGPSWINTERFTIRAGAEGWENRAMMNGPML